MLTILSNPAYWGQHGAWRWDGKSYRREVDSVTGTVKKTRVVKIRELGDVRVSLPDAAPPLVAEDMVRLVHERLKSNQEKAARNNKHPEWALLRGGHIICGGCGNPMLVSTNSPGKPVYRCSRRYPSSGSTLNRCPVYVRMSAHAIDTEVWDGVMTILANPYYFESEMAELIDQGGKTDVIEALRHHIKGLEVQEENIARAIRYMSDEVGSARLVADLRSIAREKQNAENELARIEQEDVDRETAKQQLREVQAMMNGITKAGHVMTYAKKRAVLYLLNIRVVLYPRDHQPRYTVTAGKQRDMRLPLMQGDCVQMVQAL